MPRDTDPGRHPLEGPAVVERLVEAALGIATVGAAAAFALRRRRASAPDARPPAAAGGERGAVDRPANRAEPVPSVPTGATPARDGASVPAAAAWESAWHAPLDDSRARLEINLAIAESAMRSQRPRNPYFDEAGRRRATQLIRIIRTGDDEAAWAALEPLTTSGEILHLVDFARANGGVFSAQSLLACAERLWSRKLARSASAQPRREARAGSR